MTSRGPARRESFLVWVWWKPGQGTHEVRVQHVRSGEMAVVHDLDEIAAFIERWVPRPTEKERRRIQ
jgi:hypothetical protein